VGLPPRNGPLHHPGLELLRQLPVRGLHGAWGAVSVLSVWHPAWMVRVLVRSILSAVSVCATHIPELKSCMWGYTTNMMVPAIIAHGATFLGGYWMEPLGGLSYS
jgi:hypothetical protein